MVSKNDLVRRVKDQLEGVTLKDITTILDVACDEIVKATVAGEGVRIMGFASVEPIVRPEHKGTNPATGESIIVPETKTVKIKASDVWKKALNA